MKYIRVLASGSSKEPWISALMDGLRRHGVQVWGPNEGLRPVDAVVCWGWKQGKRHRVNGRNVLIMERAYISDRRQYISLGWNGLNGRATFPRIEDGGERWRQHFSNRLKPWRENGDCIVLMGQVATDAAVLGHDIQRWCAKAAEELKERGLPVLFRPHPRDVAHGKGESVPGAPTLHGTLNDALERAALVVTWNSGSGVDAALAGVPVIACDEGSMAWPVAAHGLHEPIIKPDRSAWCAQLAWCQWSLEEVRNGTAWEHVMAACPSVR